MLTVLYTLFSLLCSLFSVLCTLFSVLCSLFSVLCTLYSFHFHIVPRGNISTAKPVGPLLEKAELDKRVAVDTRIWGTPREIALNKRLHDKAPEFLAYIGHMMRYSQALCKCGSILHSLEPGITGHECKPFYPIALLKEHAAHCSTVNTAAHSNKNTFFFKHNQSTRRSVKKNI